MLVDSDLEPLAPAPTTEARAPSRGAALVEETEVERTSSGVRASFAAKLVEPLDPMFAVDGFSMGLVYDTELAGRLAVQLHDPHVDQVAYAILTDLLEIAERG